jgi:hypothetical protein
MLVLASAEGVAGITAGATLLAATGLAAVTVHTKRLDLDHNRELADLADLRELLDNSAVALNDADEARIALEVSFAQHGRKVPPEPLDAAKEAGRALYVLRERLHVRLGWGDPIAQSFDEAIAALLSIWQAVSRLEEDDDATALQESRSTIAAARRSFTEGFVRFIIVAVERAGTVEMRQRTRRLTEWRSRLLGANKVQTGPTPSDDTR